jgi:hypothetical protein
MAGARAGHRPRFAAAPPIPVGDGDPIARYHHANPFTRDHNLGSIPSRHIAHDA